MIASRQCLHPIAEDRHTVPEKTMIPLRPWRDCAGAFHSIVPHLRKGYNHNLNGSYEKRIPEELQNGII